MLISVIIPVYNAENFIRTSVESALNQAEVQEVILVEDGSSDNSLLVCQELQRKYPNVILLQHAELINKGAGASRNLGLKNASSEYIAFLDADDFYLPYRFRNTQKMFKKYSDIDGIFEMVGVKYYDDIAKTKHALRLQKAENPVENGMNTMLRVRENDNIFESLILFKNGWIHLDGLTIKKRLLNRIGFFNEYLRISQDSEFILRCAFHGTLKSGEKDHIVSVRGVHKNNRILKGNRKSNFQNRSLFINTIFKYYINESISNEVKIVLLLRKIESYPYYLNSKGFIRKVIKFFYLFFHLLKYPFFLNSLFSIFKK